MRCKGYDRGSEVLVKGEEDMSLPSISSYGQYSSDNYGAHCLRVDMGSVTVWFSYRTPVAFRVHGHNRVVRQNDWGPTTGKHLKWIDGGDKRNRVDSDTFEKLWKEQVEPTLNPQNREDQHEVNSDWAVGVNLS